MLTLIDKHISNSSNKEILILNCGSGVYLEALKQYGNITGIDFCDEALAYNKNTFEGEFVKGRLPFEIKLEENKYDLIIINEALEYTTQDAWSLDRLKQYLKKEGKILICVPALPILTTTENKKRNMERRYTLRQLRRLMEEVGLNIIKASYINLILFPVTLFITMLNKTLKEEDLFEKVPLDMINELCYELFRLEKYIINKTGLPFGTDIMAVCSKGEGKPARNEFIEKGKEALLKVIDIIKKKLDEWKQENPNF